MFQTFPSVFAYCKQSKNRDGNGLGIRLDFQYGHCNSKVSLDKDNLCIECFDAKKGCVTTRSACALQLAQPICTASSGTSLIVHEP